MFLIYMIHMLTFVSVFYTANQLKHISKELILFAGNYLLAIILQLFKQQINECVTSGGENTKSDCIIFEYIQLLVCNILINIISFEAVHTITVNICVNLVAVKDMCHKELLLLSFISEM